MPLDIVKPFLDLMTKNGATNGAPLPGPLPVATILKAPAL
jgi:hypothetical protein